MSDKFWERVEPLIPKAKRDKTKAYQRRKGGGRIFVQMQDTLVKKSKEIMQVYRYEPHIRPRGEEKIAIQNGFKAHRWIVEVVHS